MGRGSGIEGASCALPVCTSFLSLLMLFMCPAHVREEGRIEACVVEQTRAVVRVQLRRVRARWGHSGSAFFMATEYVPHAARAGTSANTRPSWHWFCGPETRPQRPYARRERLEPARVMQRHALGCTPQHTPRACPRRIIYFRVNKNERCFRGGESEVKRNIEWLVKICDDGQLRETGSAKVHGDAATEVQHGAGARHPSLQLLPQGLPSAGARPCSRAGRARSSRRGRASATGPWGGCRRWGRRAFDTDEALVYTAAKGVRSARLPRRRGEFAMGAGVGLKRASNPHQTRSSVLVTLRARCVASGLGSAGPRTGGLPALGLWRPVLSARMHAVSALSPRESCKGTRSDALLSMPREHVPGELPTSAVRPPSSVLDGLKSQCTRGHPPHAAHAGTSANTRPSWHWFCGPETRPQRPYARRERLEPARVMQRHALGCTPQHAPRACPRRITGIRCAGNARGVGRDVYLVDTLYQLGRAAMHARAYTACRARRNVRECAAVCACAARGDYVCSRTYEALHRRFTPQSRQLPRRQ
ncbi:hypothetical protein FB451DRAFT_1185551 [Mycena latifolia]|nr:hypothetical protein FB451DRAFT_1185551 [Mycena latifolia]